MATELSADANRTVPDPLLDRLRLATLGSYDIAGELGRGGMAIVYVGRDLTLERTVAIKVMDPRLSLAHGMAERFLQEARIAARLQHPNIIIVHDIRRSDDLIFFVMSLVEGGAVDELCRQPGLIPVDQTRWILLQATRALAHAHSEGIIHRDVKPANILVNLKGDVILTDFGIAKAVGGSALTQSGTQVGTPTYMSPEQFADRPVGPASDQYALGVTAYQLLTGSPPFSGDLYSLIAAHGAKAPTPIRELRPDCPAFLANAVMRMLEKRPEDRWPSLEDLQGVFGAGMTMDGGTARKQLALAARALQQQRAATITALSVKAPLSPVPTNSSPTGRPTPPPSASLFVTLSPPNATIFVGGTLELKVHVASDTGEPVATGIPTFLSSNPAVVRVTPNGILAGVSAGTASVRATVHGASETAEIRVERAPLARLAVTTPQLTLRVGDTAQPAISALDVNGESRTDISLAWISRTPTVAHLESPGTIRAVTPGHAVIDVSAGNVRRLIDVTVLPRPITRLSFHPPHHTLELGEALPLAIEAFDDLDQPATPSAVRWTSSAPAAVHVDSAGTALAIGPGVAEITADVDGISATVTLEAVEAPVGTIELSLAASTAEVGDDVPMVLRVWDTGGSLRSAAGVQLWSSTPAVADVDPDQSVVRTHSTGSARLHATAEPVGDTPAPSAHVDLTVTAGTLARIEVFPTVLDLEPGAVAAITAHYLDRRGAPLPDNPGTWHTSSAPTATVDANGVVRAVGPGRAELVVSAVNVHGITVETRVPIRVRPPTVARVVVLSQRTTLAVGESTALHCTAYDNSGSVINEISPAWRSSSPTVATIDAAGHLEALAPGRAVITATADGQTGEWALTVRPAPLAHLAIGPTGGDALVGVPFTLAVDARDTAGHVVTPRLRWSLEPVTAARVTPEGVVTPLEAGAFTVHATLDAAPDQSGEVPDGVRDTMLRLAARAPRVQAVQLDRESLALVVGKRSRVTAKVVMEGDGALPAPAVSFSSSDENVVRVEAGGEFHAVAAGECVVTARAGDAAVTLHAAVRASRVPGNTRRLVLLAGGGGALAVLAFVLWPSNRAVPGTNAPTTPAPLSVTATAAPTAPVVEAPRPAATPPADVPSPPRDSSAAPAPSVHAAAAPQKSPALPKASGKSTAASAASAKAALDSARNAAAGSTSSYGTRPYGTSAAVRDTPAVAPKPIAPQPVYELPNIDDVRAQAADVAERIGSGAVSNAELRKFLENRPTVALVPGSVRILAEEQGWVRAQFELRLSSYNGGGVQQRRAANVIFEVGGRRGAAESRRIEVGPLTKAP